MSWAWMTFVAGAEEQHVLIVGVEESHRALFGLGAEVQQALTKGEEELH